MNVLFIIADALRADRLHCCGNPNRTSPVIDRLAREGVLFSNVIANANHTVPGLVSLFTGLYAVSHGISDQAAFKRWKDLFAGWRTPFGVLRENGYRVAGDDPEFYYPLGFDTGSRDVGANLRKHRGEKFFIWHRSEETHLPYNPRPPYDTAFLPEGFAVSDSLHQRLEAVKRCILVHRPGLTSRLESGVADAIEVHGYRRNVGIATFSRAERPAILALYDGMVKMLDEEIGQYMDLLKELGLLEDTMVVITSDHGEQLLERGAVGHCSCSLEGNLYDENIRIPLILYCPALLPKGTVIDCQVSQVDVMPTIFEVLGLQMPQPTDGRSLLSLILGHEGKLEEETYAETSPCGWQALDEDERMIWCIRRPPWKLVKCFDPQKGDAYELFDLDADPGENHNLFADQREVAAMLQRKLQAWIAGKNRRICMR